MNVIKVKVSNEVKEHIKYKASRLGLTMAGYMRFLAIKDTAEGENVAPLLVVHNLDEVSKQINRMRLAIGLRKIKIP
jgi:antitoxin component of RelBE/YafQ-DinJ toxin-antitoxin module